jgi:hypothetical protein
MSPRRLAGALFVCVGASACSEYDLSPEKSPNPGADTAPPPDTAPPDRTCDGFAAPPPYTAVVDDACVAPPEVGTFTPVVEWQWADHPAFPGYDQVMSTPVVGHLTDDDGDGTVGDADDVPDIVVASYAGSAYTSAGVLTALSGDGTGVHWSVSAPGGQSVYGCGGPAIGDLDADGRPEVCTAGVSAAVVCLDGETGAFRWAAGGETSAYGAPAMGDLDADGVSEVVFGRQAFRADGTAMWVGTGGQGSGYAFSFTADWDLDGRQDLVAGNTVYAPDGSVLWTHPYEDGIPAAADLDFDGAPDLVQVGAGMVTAVSNSGALLFRTALPGGGGGPPTVADFDGDGAPEVGVAGRSAYSVIDTDGSVLWSTVTQDFSSSITGSAVFDFEGDGDAEVVYADEETLWIYEGATGAVLLAEWGHASGTLFEYPVIADVDGDGATEILLASNQLSYTGWEGLTVIGDADSSWAPARETWNQFAYAISNIDDDGSIPAAPVPNWALWNTFRAGGTREGLSQWRANLAPGAPAVCLDACDEGRVHLFLPVESRGLIGPSGTVAVGFHPHHPSSDPVAGTTFAGLPSGVARWVGPFTLTEAEWGPGVLVAVVDGPGAVEECDEGDNTRDLGPWPCP